MAAAVLRFGMVFYGVVLVMLVFCNSDTVTGQSAKNTSTTTVPPATKGNSTTVSTLKPTSKAVPTTPSTAVPSNGTKSTPSSNGTKTTPSSNGTKTTPSSNGTKTTPSSNGTKTTAPSPTTHGNATVSSTNMKSPTPTPEGHGGDRGKWVATGFAVFFLITTIVMTVLYCRQRKIYRELEGDSSLSRLI